MELGAQAKRPGQALPSTVATESQVEGHVWLKAGQGQ